MLLRRLSIALIVTFASTPTLSQEKLNSAEAFRACKTIINERTDGTVYHKFNRDYAVSTRKGHYSLRINSTMRNEQKKYLLRSRCELSYSGELLDIEIEEGRW